MYRYGTGIVSVYTSVADPFPQDTYVFGLLDPDPVVRGTDSDPDSFIIKQ
jgi:hypothetical protein